MSTLDSDPELSSGTASSVPDRESGSGGARGGFFALAVGLVIGLLLLGLAQKERTFAGLDRPELTILVNGLDARTGRDLLLPVSGWVVHVVLPTGLPDEVRETLAITLREERTGTTIDVTDRFTLHDDVAALVVPESLGLGEGLFSIRARLLDEEQRELARHRRVRIRGWLGGPPIGQRQVIHFDFAIDRDADGRPDFEQDLERLGLASARAPGLGAQTAKAVSQRALARVLRAYDPEDDPNGTFRERDTVFVRFVLEAEPNPVTTRICVGGLNAAFPGSIGNVRFDPRNSIKGQQECAPRDEEPAAGLFPSELAIYKDSPLYSEVLGEFDPAHGGTPLGDRPQDVDLLDPLTITPRARAAQRAIAVVGDVLGTVMAHEAGHALGLVAPGKPGVGLFGGRARDGADRHHNMSVMGGPAEAPWLMNEGRGFRFEDLAGEGSGGELRFRPLNHAYLKDRVVLAEDTRP
jgi:hypothetical protein